MSRSLGGRLFTIRSPICSVPWVMSASPAIIRRAVDFPHPDGPTRTMNSPSGISRLRSCTACTPWANVLSTRFSTIWAIAFLRTSGWLNSAAPAWVLGLALYDGESAGGHGHGDGRGRADGDAPLASLTVVARGDGLAGAGHRDSASALGVSLAVEQGDALPVARGDQDGDQRGEQDRVELSGAAQRAGGQLGRVGGQDSRQGNRQQRVRAGRDTLGTAAAVLRCAKVLGTRREVADRGGSGYAGDDGLHEARLVVGRGGSGQRAARGQLDVGAAAPLRFAGTDRVGRYDFGRPGKAGRLGLDGLLAVAELHAGAGASDRGNVGIGVECLHGE